MCNHVWGPLLKKRLSHSEFLLKERSLRETSKLRWKEHREGVCYNYIAHSILGICFLAQCSISDPNNNDIIERFKSGPNLRTFPNFLSSKFISWWRILLPPSTYLLLIHKCALAKCLCVPYHGGGRQHVPGCWRGTWCPLGIFSLTVTVMLCCWWASSWLNSCLLFLAANIVTQLLVFAFLPS